MPQNIPPIALFGYNSSPFTNKIRLTLRLMQIPYTFIHVTSMMPRPLLTKYFGLTYRKIPVLAIGRDVFADTSLIIEWLHTHPELKAYRQQAGSDTQEIYSSPRERVMGRLLSSFYTDRPLFRLTTGLIPGVVWQTQFGRDREGLIGHAIDAKKLAEKVPRNLVALDTHLSLLEPMFESGSWILGGDRPGALDLNLWYQLQWGEAMSRGEGIEDLTGGGTSDESGKRSDAIELKSVLNEKRYPGIWAWYERFEAHVNVLPTCETIVEKGDEKGVREIMERLATSERQERVSMLPTPNARMADLEDGLGLRIGSKVSIAPDDTGRANPTLGRLVATSPEEIVIEPEQLSEGTAKIEGVRLHFPRIGFVVMPIKDSKL